MALTIEDPETYRLARELAARTGQPITAALRDAIREKLDAIRAHETVAGRPGLADIIARGRARRTPDKRSDDQRSDDEILGYDEDGLPA